MKKSFNSILFFLVALSTISAIFFGCNTAKDPYDEGFPPAKWAPAKLEAEVGDNCVQLTWEQAIEFIDGFIIERSPDSLNWEFLTKKMVDGNLREYLDTTIITGEVYFYRMYAKAGTNISNYCYSNVVIVPLQLPSVITTDVSGIESTSVIFNGAVTKDGGKPVTERGFCYSLKPQPTVKDQKIAVGTGTGAFTKPVEKLNYGTTYYLRAYATNENGTAYGNEKEFKTLAVLAHVVTDELNNIDSSSVSIYGNVLSDGKGTVTERGFCYSENGEPNYNSERMACGAGVGTFSANIKNLKWATKYYINAYAVNEIGVSYSGTSTFFTKCNCEKKYGNFTDERDNQNYKTINIGSQTWMAENLKYLPYSNRATNWTADKPCYTSSGYDGVFYNMKAATTACPSGWHLPSDQEWETLLNYLIDNGYN